MDMARKLNQNIRKTGIGFCPWITEHTFQKNVTFLNCPITSDFSERKKMTKRLSRAALFKIVNYLNQNWEMLKQEKLSKSVLEQKIRNETETEVKFENIVRICRDMERDVGDICLKRQRNGLDGAGTGHATDRIRLLASQVSALVTELQRCYSLLGEEFNINGHINPPLIRAIVGGKSLKVYKEETKETVSSK